MIHPVTPADREAWLRLNNQPPEWAAKIRAGDFDDASTLQLLAGHRIEAERAKVAEIAAAWQPMETAPKDGTIVQLFDPVAEPPVSVGCWDEQAGMDGRPGWLIAEADFMPSLCRPRCWAPLLTRPDRAPAANAERDGVSYIVAKIVAKIVAELRDLDGQREESNLLGWAANHIEAQFGGKSDERL